MKMRRKAIQLTGFTLSVFSFLIVLGLLAKSLSSPSLVSFLGLALSFIFLYPVGILYRNFDSIREVLSDKLREKKPEIVLTIIIFLGSYYSFLSARSIPVLEVFNLSYRAMTPVFFPLKLFYSHLNPFLGDIIFDYGRLYSHLVMIYIISGFLTSIFGRANDLLATDGDFLKASVIPFSGSAYQENSIEVYIVTGFHGLIWIPESFCRECHLFVNAAREASDKVESEVDIEVKSYWSRFLRPLLKGGYHPPVMLVNGELVAQGYDVPDPVEISEMIENTD
ncbi:MAG: hypothetical protein ABEJ56_02740 [Candidatus Nanohaloarchaea archaeon]